MKRAIEIEIQDGDVELLEIAAKADAIPIGVGPPRLEDLVAHLLRHAADGVRRPGSWERGWLIQVLGTDWTAHLERDPECAWHERPRRRGAR